MEKLKLELDKEQKGEFWQTATGEGFLAEATKR
jgi:hypothetical protein